MTGDWNALTRRTVGWLFAAATFAAGTAWAADAPRV